MIGPTRTHTFGEPPSQPKKPRSHPEANIQAKVVAWLRDRPKWSVSRIENEGKRTYDQSRRAKALGMNPGDPDTLLIYGCRVIWHEHKSESGRLSDAQIRRHAELRARGQVVIVTYSYEEAINKLEAIENEL